MKLFQKYLRRKCSWFLTKMQVFPKYQENEIQLIPKDQEKKISQFLKIKKKKENWFLKINEKIYIFGSLTSQKENSVFLYR